MEEIRYEGFGPGGVGLIVEVLTDNRNRAAANVRTTFSKNGGNLGETGSVAFMFDRVGQIVYPASAGGEEAVMEAAIEAGAEDVESDEDGHEIITAFEDFADVVDGAGGQPRPGQDHRHRSGGPRPPTPIEGDDAGHPDEADRRPRRRGRRPERLPQRRHQRRGLERLAS